MQSDKDYGNYAKAILRDHQASPACFSLRDGVVKIAQEIGLNPNETRRLIEKTNVAAHLALFDKHSQENYVEFDVVDPDDVMGELFGQVPVTSDGCKTASVRAHIHEVLDYRTAFRNLTRAAQTEKVASAFEFEPYEGELEKVAAEKRSSRKMFNDSRYRERVRRELESKVGQLDDIYHAKIEEIVKKASYYDQPDMAAVIADASSRYAVTRPEMVRDLVYASGLSPDTPVKTAGFKFTRACTADLEALEAVHIERADYANALALLGNT